MGSVSLRLLSEEKGETSRAFNLRIPRSIGATRYCP